MAKRVADGGVGGDWTRVFRADKTKNAAIGDSKGENRVVEE